MIIKPFTEFKIKDKLYFSHREINTEILNSYIILDLINKIDYPNINAFPTEQYAYNNIEEKYLLDNYFIKIGEVKDICLT